MNISDVTPFLQSPRRFYARNTAQAAQQPIHFQGLPITRLEKAQKELSDAEAAIAKKYTKKDRWDAAWTALKNDLKKSNLVKAGFISSLLLPVSLIMPHIAVFLLPIPLFLFTLAFVFSYTNASDAYKDPESAKKKRS